MSVGPGLPKVGVDRGGGLGRRGQRESEGLVVGCAAFSAPLGGVSIPAAPRASNALAWKPRFCNCGRHTSKRLYFDSLPRVCSRPFGAVPSGLLFGRFYDIGYSRRFLLAVRHCRVFWPIRGPNWEVGMGLLECARGCTRKRCTIMRVQLLLYSSLSGRSRGERMMDACRKYTEIHCFDPWTAAVRLSFLFSSPARFRRSARAHPPCGEGTKKGASSSSSDTARVAPLLRAGVL